MAVRALAVTLTILVATGVLAAGEPSFYAPFEGTAVATRCDSGAAAPALARGLQFVPGVSGQAVYVGRHGEQPYEQMPLLEYDAGRHLASPQGTVMFWVSPDWDGYFTDPVKFETYFLFSAFGGRDTPDFATREVAPDSGTTRAVLFMWNWLRLDLSAAGDKAPASLAWRCRHAWMRGDWWHLAFTWGAEGWGKLYVNGLPEVLKVSPKLADSQRFYLGCVPKVWNRNCRANAAFDELAIYPRALSAAEIGTAYRRVAPVDLAVERRYLRAREEEKLALEVTAGAGTAVPGGTLTVTVTADAGGGTMATKQVPLETGVVALPLGKLQAGDYRATCTVRCPGGLTPRPPLRNGEGESEAGGGAVRGREGESEAGGGAVRGREGGAEAGTLFRRSFPLTVYAQAPAPAVSAADVTPGERLFGLDCTATGNGLLESTPSTVKTVEGVGSYREAGAGKWDRFGYEVAVPGADGSPVLLEVTWPDDRERAMSLYMLPATASPQHRDRLSGGLQCGGEYPLSGKLQKVRYLFYPTEERYLFEVRTLVPGLPAAVSRLELYRLDGRLPKLPVTAPAGLPGRSFGHLDEDQSFEVLFGSPGESTFPRSGLRYGYPVQTFERLLDYFDYTGQNVMSYCLARYHWTHYDEGPVNPVDLSLRSAGWVDLLLDMMRRRGQHLLGAVNLYTVPAPGAEADGAEQRAAAGYFSRDRNGKTRAGGAHPGLGDNPAHPAVRARFRQIVAELLRRYGTHPAFAGVDLWYSERPPVFFGSLDWGYDDYTVALFGKETGVQVPGDPGAADRYAARYSYLTGEGRAKWLAWRARKNLDLLGELDRLVRRTRPDLQLQVSVSGWYSGDPGFLDREQGEDLDFARFAYEDLGLDLAAVKRLPSVVLAPMPDGTFYRWLKHWYGGRESILGELNHNVAKLRAWRNGARSASAIYLRYFESFMKSLKQETYPGYFQNSDPKAHGRYFLQDFAVAIAAQDAARITVGAQPLGTTGRDAEAREFAAAYRALPVGRFSDVPGLADPVTVRYLRTPAGTYLYAVSLLWSPLSVALDLGPAVGQAVDLSTGKPLPSAAGALRIDLQPYQLRSFRLASKTAAPRGGKVTVPDGTRRWFAEQLSWAREQVAALAASGGDSTGLTARLGLIERELQAGHYAEAHRLLCSKLMRGIAALRESAQSGYPQERAAMIARSEYAVDCGSLAFYRSKSGRLFLPDRKYEPGSYGYDGGYQSVTRSIAGSIGSTDPVLFATEAYDLEAYRFTVKPGTYTVRLHLKVGYEPGAKPGVFVLNVDLEGKRALDRCDLFTAAGSEFRRAWVREFRGVEVKDGVLDIAFSVPPGIDPTARLCDAIEVAPE